MQKRGKTAMQKNNFRNKCTLKLLYIHVYYANIL